MHEIFAGIDIVSDTEEIAENDPKSIEHVDIETLKKKIGE
jgi:hypothetical protein